MSPASVINLLLIEDDADDALIIREILSRGPNGASASTVVTRLEITDNLTAGLARVAKGGIDLVLLDLSLPECRGIETLRRFVGAEPDIPVIVLTALNDESIALEALGQGAQDYWVKGQVNKMFF